MGFGHGRLRAVLMAGLAAGCAAALPACREQPDEALLERVQAAEDYIAIERMLMKYAAALNTGDADTYVSLFTPDAEFVLLRNVGEEPFAGPFVGHDALRKQWFGNVAADNDTRKFGPMRHVTTNYEIDIDGDTAKVRAFFIEIVSTGMNSPGGSKPPKIHQMGRYEDELVKVDGQWLFKKRAVITDLNEAWQPDPPADAS